MANVRVESPYSGEAVAEVPLLELAEATRLLERSARAQRDWARVPLAERLKVVERFNAWFEANKERVARDITQQMGKPLGQARGEVDGMLVRSRHLGSLAEQALADTVLEKPGFARRIAREPVGVVLNIAPWNYPLLTVINVAVPAVLAGNGLLIKHAPQTPLCGQHFAEAFAAAGAPEGLVGAFQASHEAIAELVKHPALGYVAFTGSVRGGHEVYRAVAQSRFIDVGLELGGKDPGYVAEDANFQHAVENLVDGAFYNAGQSCCGIERIYVHASHYDRFVEAAVELVKAYKLGDPLADGTSLGPLTLPGWPKFIEGQVEAARQAGGRVLCGGKATQVGGKGRFFDPSVVADAPQASALMQEESFGPVVGITRVRDDAEAVRLMNDSRYGLTAAIWTEDPGRAERLARDLEAGTVFMNRCDYLDPGLPWTGVKDSGKGESLSHLGFQHVTRAKSLHFRLKTS